MCTLLARQSASGATQNTAQRDRQQDQGHNVKENCERLDDYLGVMYVIGVRSSANLQLSTWGWKHVRTSSV